MRSCVRVVIVADVGVGGVGEYIVVGKIQLEIQMESGIDIMRVVTVIYIRYLGSENAVRVVMGIGESIGQVWLKREVSGMVDLGICVWIEQGLIGVVVGVYARYWKQPIVKECLVGDRHWVVD